MPTTINASVQKQIRELKDNGLWAALAQEFYVPTAAYTPDYNGATPGTTTYSAGYPVGYYTRAGDTVHCWGVAAWTGATGTGDARITLPFAAATLTNMLYPVALRISGVTFASTFVQGVIISGASYFILQTVATNANATTIAVEAAGTIAWSAVYPIQ